MPNYQSVMKCGTFSSEWHFHFRGQSSQDYFFFFFPKGSIFSVSFILPSLQKHTYLLLSSLALALCCQTCLHINLVCKSMLSEAEEIVHSHPISHICFFLQADGLVRASRCLSHAAGGFTPAGKWAVSPPPAALPAISLQAWATHTALPPAAPQGAAPGPRRRTHAVLSCPPGGAVGQRPIPSACPYAGAPSLCVTMTPVPKAPSSAPGCWDQPLLPLGAAGRGPRASSPLCTSPAAQPLPPCCLG